MDIKKIIKEEVGKFIGESKIQDLKSLPFYEDIKNVGGKIFQVGGAVRDKFLGLESKDLDILITGVPMDSLEKVLEKYGNVDLVGKSFGVLKFKEFGETEDIDIAIPRSEKKVGDGHKGFEVSSDHNLPIEDDLFRRDLKLNSMAMDSDGNIIDPYGGMEDIKNKKISLTNPDSFKDDPLRMLRSIQFSSRFDFDIEDKTLQAIKDNAHRISEIPGERILTELDKIVSKGNKQKGLELLIETGLFKEIFGKDFKGDISEINKAKDMADFIYLMLKNNFEKPSVVFKNVLKGDLDSEKKIEALTLTRNHGSTPYGDRALIFKMNKISPRSIESNLLSDDLKTASSEMKSNKYPLTTANLEVNGNDLMDIGIKGKAIGESIGRVINAIFKDQLKNKKEDILKYITYSNFQ